MKIAYFDCFSGASGDMILGALLDAGLPLASLKREIAKLRLEHYDIDGARVVKRGISGTQVMITIDQDYDGHRHRHLRHIKEIISTSSLDPAVKERSISIFSRLAEVEAQVHNIDAEAVHFHEVGAMDAIVDVVGAVAGLHLLGIKQLFCSPIHVGSGTVTCAHGVLPVPAPATALLIRGLPVYATGVKGELLTPTGAAILSTLCSEFGSMPSMCIESIGYGAGMSDPGIPNLLRVCIGDSPGGEAGPETEQVAVVETNVDDMTPQIYDYLMEMALTMGAKDIFLSPVQMKKNRPGTMVTILCLPREVSRFAELLLSETTSIGVRWHIENRLKAGREIKEIMTPYGKIHVKYAIIGDGIVNIAPEYDDCKNAAIKHHVPLKVVMETVRKLAE